jgi:hypothetical protein
MNERDNSLKEQFKKVKDVMNFIYRYFCNQFYVEQFHLPINNNINDDYVEVEFTCIQKCSKKSNEKKKRQVLQDKIYE